MLGGRYRLNALIGGGASAEVFAAEDVVLARQVAVKILHPALAADPAFLRRFQAEAQVAAALRHINVLAVHDWGYDDGTPFLVTELLEGGSLKGLLDQGFRATPAQALQLGLEACRGLDHAHRRGLVHRDVKPANLLLDAEGRLCVADFGLARAIAEAAATEPLGVVLGTARYASPEQVEGRPVDGRSDVYSLALVLVEAITGEVPFAAETSAATLLARLERPLEPPPEVGPLAEALAAAGRTDHDGRSDAATFGRMLKGAAPGLDPPAPLPVIRIVGPAAAPAPSQDDLTVDVAPVGPWPYDGAGEGGDGDDPEATVNVAPSPVAPRAPPPPAREDAVEAVETEAPAPRKRRRGRLVLLLVLLLLVGGLAAGAVVLQPWRPTVDVPQIVGLSRDEAAARLRGEDLSLRVADRLPSETVEAGDVVSSKPQRQRQGRAVTVTLSSGPEERVLPAAAGRPAKEVSKELSGLGLVPTLGPIDSETVAIDTVISLDPAAGSRVPRGAAVTITVSAGPPARPIPDVRGKSLDDSIATLQAAGLKATAVEVFDDKVARGAVVTTNPAAGIEVRPGLAVAVNVSKGPDLVAVPALAGRTPASAEQALRAAGLVASATFGPPTGQVFSSEPATGARIRRGSAVALYTR